MRFSRRPARTIGRQMDSNAQDRTREFLKVAPQFQLGGLVTEGSHPVTAELSQTARSSTAAALRMLLEVDRDVVIARLVS